MVLTSGKVDARGPSHTGAEAGAVGGSGRLFSSLPLCCAPWLKHCGSGRKIRRFGRSAEPEPDHWWRCARPGQRHCLAPRVSMRNQAKRLRRRQLVFPLQLQLRRQHHGFRAIVRVQGSEDRRQVDLHSPRPEVQRPRDLLVGMSLGQQPQHVDLPRGESRRVAPGAPGGQGASTGCAGGNALSCVSDGAT